MRLWHWRLLPYLPRQQLISQFRECCAIARNIHENGSSNHLLVNRVMEYPEDEFNTYTEEVIIQMQVRGYKVDPWKFFKWRNNKGRKSLDRIFLGWHANGYLRQNMANLMEKYWCSGITEDEWNLLCHGYNVITGEVYEL